MSWLSCNCFSLRGVAVFSDAAGLVWPFRCQSKTHMSTNSPCPMHSIKGGGLGIKTTIADLRVCGRSSNCEAVSVLLHPVAPLSSFLAVLVVCLPYFVHSRSQSPCAGAARCLQYLHKPHPQGLFSTPRYGQRHSHALYVTTAAPGSLQIGIPITQPGGYRPIAVKLQWDVACGGHMTTVVGGCRLICSFLP